MKRTSPVHRLKPILDADGVLRVGERLPQADLRYAAKHPVLLPKRTHLTNLIIRTSMNVPDIKADQERTAKSDHPAFES